MSGFFSGGTCNSDKCHCPKCKPTITVTRDMLDVMIKQRVDEAVADMKREQFEKRERERYAESTLANADRAHKRDQAERIAALGVRQNYRAAHPEIYANYEHSRRLAELHETNRGLNGEHMTYYSRDNACYWKWQKCGYDYVGWRKRNKLTGELFGPRYRRVEFTRDGFKTNTRDIIRLPLPDTLGRQHSAFVHTETERVGEIEKTETIRYEFEGGAATGETENGYKPRVTALMLSVLFHRAAYSSAVPYSAFNSTSFFGALSKLEGLGLVVARFPDYTLTEAGRAYVKSVQQRGV